MTYFWICVSAWLSLNAVVIAQVVHDVVVDRRAAGAR